MWMYLQNPSVGWLSREYSIVAKTAEEVDALFTSSHRLLIKVYSGNIIDFRALSDSSSSIAHQLATALKLLHNSLIAHNNRSSETGIYYFKRNPAPRYWRSNDPFFRGRGI